MAEIGIELMPFLEGRVPRRVFLESHGFTIATWISLSPMPEGAILTMVADGFEHNASLRNGNLELRRNGFVASLPLSVSAQEHIDEANRVPLECPCHIALTWSPTTISVAVNGNGTSVTTPKTLPPNSLIGWARQQAIIPVIKYKTHRHFADEILNGLAGLQDKIATSRMEPAFWDFTYDGRRIVTRSPKRETQVHPTIHGLLHDLAIAKNLEVHPEASSGAGRMDFLITGTLDDGTIVKACIEFKNAHSEDVLHGMVRQLPSYMRTHATDVGYYCIPWFQGRHFDQPDQPLKEFRGSLVSELVNAGLKDIGLVIIDVSGGVAPSKTTHIAQ